VNAPTDRQVIDCSGSTVVAGFWNRHVHLTERKWADAANLPGELNAQLRDFARFGHDRLALQTPYVDSATEQVAFFRSIGGTLLFGTEYGAVEADPVGSCIARGKANKIREMVQWSWIKDRQRAWRSFANTLEARMSTI
jgi:hypothetical protein